MQASEFIFAGSPQPFDMVHSPLHRVLGTGHLAAAWSIWILKVYVFAIALLKEAQLSRYTFEMLPLLESGRSYGLWGDDASERPV